MFLDPYKIFKCILWTRNFSVLNLVVIRFEGLKRSGSHSLISQSQILYFSSYDVPLDSAYGCSHSYKSEAVGLMTRLCIGLPKIRGLIPCTVNGFFTSPFILALTTTDWDSPPFKIGQDEADHSPVV